MTRFPGTLVAASAGAVLLACAIAIARPDPPAPDAPQFTPDHRLLRPDHYREWIYLSSGLGMSYSADMNMEPQFDNVFVNSSAYRFFVASGTWPDHTILVLEVRSSESKGSINRAGHFQGNFEAIEVHVKDSVLPGKWAFFDFSKSPQSAKAIAQTADCYGCHQEHGAVDTTFVQFYPTLLDIARSKGTVRPSY